MSIINLQKYFAFVTYFGRNFNGSQIQIWKNKEMITVQGELQVCIKSK